MANVIEIRPHDTFKYPKNMLSIFLAGTIDMGNSRNWQEEFVNEVKSWKDEEVTYVIYNPRRVEDFGKDLEEFDYQVKWELNQLEAADLIVMHILGTSKSPITLLELGLFARSGKLEVICEPEFYRYDNVRITCDRYSVPIYKSMDEFLKTFESNK